MPMSRDRGSSFPTSSPWFTAITFDDSSSDTVTWNLEVNFICISLRVRDAEHVYKYSLAIRVARENCFLLSHFFFVFREYYIFQSLIKCWLLALV